MTENANWSADTQSAAMMMAANNAITHTPPSSCACYSATNAATAGRSNLGRGIAGPDAVSGYVSDPGQVTNEVGHSAGLFWPSLTTVGVGDALSAGNRPYNVMKYLTAPNTTNPRAPVRDASGYVSWPTCNTAFP